MARRETNNTAASSATFNNVLQLLDIEDVSKNMREILFRAKLLFNRKWVLGKYDK